MAAYCLFTGRIGMWYRVRTSLLYTLKFGQGTNVSLTNSRVKSYCDQGTETGEYRVCHSLQSSAINL